MPSEQTIHLERYTPDAKALVAGAQALADERKHVQVEPIHLLARALDRDRGVAEVFKKAGADPADVAVEAEAQLAAARRRRAAGLAYLSTRDARPPRRAPRKRRTSDTVGVEHLLNALVAGDPRPGGRGPPGLRARAGLVPAAHGGAEERAARGRRRGRRRPATPSGRALSRTISVARAREGRLRSGDRPRRRGRAGCSRSSSGATRTTRSSWASPASARRRSSARSRCASPPATSRRTSRKLAHPRARDRARSSPGAKLRGEIEERLKQSSTRVDAAGKDAHPLHRRARVAPRPGRGGAAASAICSKPLLARGEVRLLASTTPEGMRKINEKDPSLLRRFTVLTIEPPTPEQRDRDPPRHRHAVRGAPPGADRRSARSSPPCASPSATSRIARCPTRAIDLLDEAAARKRVEIDGVPARMDDAIRRVASLKAQLAALADDVDAMSVKTRERLEKEIARARAAASPRCATKLDSRRGALAASGALRKEHDEAAKRSSRRRAKEQRLRASSASSSTSRSPT